MEWVEVIQKAIKFIEEELENQKLSPELVGNYVGVSQSHFLRVFNIITGYTLSKYIRNRRLSVAGDILKSTDKTVLEVALNAGYESVEAFSKAFKRFHGINPSESKSSTLIEFYPLQVKITITQEKPLKYDIKEKSYIYLNGKIDIVPSDEEEETARLWEKAIEIGYLEKCCEFLDYQTIVGVSSKDGYTIKAKCYKESKETNLIISPSKWGIFPCEEATSEKILEVWNKIYTNWIPETEYKINDLPQLEVYYEKDNDYSCEIWIPLK